MNKRWSESKQKYVRVRTGEQSVGSDSESSGSDGDSVSTLRVDSQPNDSSDDESDSDDARSVKRSRRLSPGEVAGSEAEGSAHRESDRCARCRLLELQRLVSKLEEQLTAAKFNMFKSQQDVVYECEELLNAARVQASKQKLD